MPYEPIENVDYVIDLYAVVGANIDTEPAELRRALMQRMVEYHPDRLEGLAPEFRSKGEVMARLLSRAKIVLLDPHKRQVYDEIMAEWEGPVSKDGTPTIRMDRYLQAEMESKTPDEIESIFTNQAEQAEAMTGYTPSRLEFLEKMITLAGDDLPDDLRAEYEAALLSYDRILAIQEAERSRLLSLPDIRKDDFRAGLNYSEDIAGAIESARVVRREELCMQVLGGVSTRLALLAGEEVERAGTNVVLATSMELPAYFDQQAKKVQELATKRQKIVEKRLANFRPVYPLSELQNQAMKDVVIGIGEEEFEWFGVTFDYETNSAGFRTIPSEIMNLLSTGEFKSIIEAGYNILTLKSLEQVDIKTQLIDAIEKHANKFGTETAD